jgi:hypothetical protein
MKIVDVYVGGNGIVYTQEEVNNGQPKIYLDFYSCPECESKIDLVKWNKTKRPCLRCKEKQEIDEFREQILWDRFKWQET